MAVSARIQIDTYKCKCAYYEQDDSYRYCSECKYYEQRKRDAEAVKQLKELQKLADVICRKTTEDGGSSTDEIPKITIEVSGGTVQNVYTTLGINVEVDILDFDDNGNRTNEERNDLIEYLKQVAAEQHQIY